MVNGNLEIPCSIGNLNYMDALADKGSDVNLMPLSIYIKLTSDKPANTNIRLSLANHSYVYPIGVAEDVLVNVASFVYPVDFVNVDDKKDECMPIILGAPFLATARATIKCGRGVIILKTG